MASREEAAATIAGMRSFIDDAPTPFHAAAGIAQILDGSGFRRLREQDAFELDRGGKYYIRRGGAIAAFRVGEEASAGTGFRVAAAHTDSPSLKLKIEGERCRKGAVTVPVEVYGGAILSSWLDRDLGIAGVLIVRDNEKIVSRLYRSDRPIASIPNVAIHLNRSVNDGFEYNKQDHLPAIVDVRPGPPESLQEAPQSAEGGVLVRYAASQIGVDPDEVVDSDLYLFDAQPGAILGTGASFLSSGRLDNLAACYATARALADAPAAPSTAVAVYFNNEEVGSRTREGADSGLLATLLERITISVGGGREEYHRALSRSFLISNDAAHAIHPNFADRHDSAYAPRLNAGPVIKYNGNFRYTTTAETAALFEELCRDCGVSVQRFVNRSDMAAGSTIGPAASSLSEMRAVDVGIPLLGMHSIRETAGTEDTADMIKVLGRFYARKEPL